MQSIYINGRFLTQSITGVQRVAFEVVKSLDELIEQDRIDGSDFAFTLLTQHNLDSEPEFKNISVERVGSLKGHLWEQLELPLYAKNGILVNLCGPAPVFRKNEIAIIHDAVPFACQREFSFAFTSWYKFMFRMLCNKSNEIITVSEFSKNEIARYCRMDESAVTVVPLGIDNFAKIKEDEGLLDRHGLRDTRFVLAVGSLSPRKNFLRLIEAMHQIDDPTVQLVVAGGINSKVFSGIDLQSDGKIKYIGRVSDGELKALYSNALFFAFPSLYEGFGLPPVEAMSCGCPVLAANAASVPEVCGDAAFYCDPNSSADMAQKIKLLISDDRLRERLSLKGFEKSKSYTWDACARQVWSVIERKSGKAGEAGKAGRDGGEDESSYAPAV